MPIPQPDRHSAVTVWDTHYLPPSKAYGFYRDALCSVYMPWMTDTDYASEFHGRFETAVTGDGTVSRNRCTPMVCVRGRLELSRSETECFYVLYVLSGYHACEQRGRNGSAGPGQIIVVDSAQPCRVENGSPPYDVICITIPKATLRGVYNLEDRLAGLVVERQPTAAPLFSCMNLISRQLTSCSQAELSAFYDACVTLLPLAAGCFEDEHKEKLRPSRDSVLLRELREYAERNACDPELSALRAAEHFGISVRYVHKLFAALGTTFSAYVTATRLDSVRADILCPERDGRQISDLAFRWGFSDLSTFNRSFKRRFGCSPTRYRSRHDT